MTRLAWSGLLAVVLLAAGCGKVTDDYPSYVDAAAAGLFEQAWLPHAVVPPSARLIRIVRQLDDGEAQGWFHFPSVAFPAVVGRLSPYVPPAKLDPAIATYIAKNQTRGYEAFEALGADAHWLFLCSAAGGKCYFKRWTSRSD
ncbi:MAG: hypothetical protein RR412_00775 [Burkholderiaceae bacterium]